MSEKLKALKLIVPNSLYSYAETKNAKKQNFNTFYILLGEEMYKLAKCIFIYMDCYFDGEMYQSNRKKGC